MSEEKNDNLPQADGNVTTNSAVTATTETAVLEQIETVETSNSEMAEAIEEIDSSVTDGELQTTVIDTPVIENQVIQDTETLVVAAIAPQPEEAIVVEAELDIQDIVIDTPQSENQILQDTEISVTEAIATLTEEVVAPISAPILQMVPLPVHDIEVAPSPKYSTMAFVPPFTVRIPATFKMTSFGEAHPFSFPVSLTPINFGINNSQLRPAITSQASAPPTPIATITRARPDTTIGFNNSECSPCSANSGANQLTSASPRLSKNPEETEPIASTAIGNHINSGDSCGCASSSQRDLPVKVRIMTRVM